jgi:hypothetical protein
MSPCGIVSLCKKMVCFDAAATPNVPTRPSSPHPLFIRAYTAEHRSLLSSTPVLGNDSTCPLAYATTEKYISILVDRNKFRGYTINLISESVRRKDSKRSFT